LFSNAPMLLMSKNLHAKSDCIHRTGNFPSVSLEGVHRERREFGNPEQGIVAKQN